MILTFDLDDTLYDEIRFVESGFRAVARNMAERWQLDQLRIYHQLLSALGEHGRGQVFDQVLSGYGRQSQRNIKRCVAVYRGHRPSIQLHAPGARCLARFGSWPKYLVTDGNKQVQHNKVVALGLEPAFKRVLITHRYGVHNAKPSPHCFLKIAELERVPMTEIVYIGDNPAKDFVGIKPLGCKTIRTLTGMHKDVRREAEFEAHTEVASLDEITPEFLRQL